MLLFRVDFKYRAKGSKDSYTKSACLVNTLDELKYIYGFQKGQEYKILKIEQVDPNFVNEQINNGSQEYNDMFDLYPDAYMRAIGLGVFVEEEE